MYRALGAMLACATVVCAQQNGSVAGTVLCADTGGPARQASVFLQAAASGGHLLFPMPSEVFSATTDLDGAFTISGVRPGEYYVVTHYAGYISPRDYIFPGVLSPEVSGRREPLPDFVQRVKVEPGATVKVSIRLQRGGSIGGRVTYSDGAPAANVGLTPKLKLRNGEFADVFGGGAVHSDSTGQYRIDGLPGGSYVVLGGIEGGMVPVKGGARVGGGGRIVFAGGGMRASKARLVVIAGTAEQSGVDMVVPLNGRRVRGSVVASDGRRIETGLVRLYPMGERRFSIATPIDADGYFEFGDIPPDTYTLALENSGATVEIRVADADVLDVKIPVR